MVDTDPFLLRSGWLAGRAQVCHCFRKWPSNFSWATENKSSVSCLPDTHQCDEVKRKQIEAAERGIRRHIVGLGDIERIRYNLRNEHKRITFMEREGDPFFLDLRGEPGLNTIKRKASAKINAALFSKIEILEEAGSRSLNCRRMDIALFAVNVWYSCIWSPCTQRLVELLHRIQIGACLLSDLLSSVGSCHPVRRTVL